MKTSGPLARPYRLQNPIRHYEWGERGSGSFIAKLLNISDPNPIPYAELWVGAHPSAPSRILSLRGETDVIPLDDAVRLWPLPILGPRVHDAFDGRWPFLLKILSAAEALSIQAHPDRALAPVLHAQDPEHYHDPNHKPELAVALDRFYALAGFKSLDGWRAVFHTFPEIAAFIGKAEEALGRAQPGDPQGAPAPGGHSVTPPLQEPHGQTESRALPNLDDLRQYSGSAFAAAWIRAALTRLLHRARQEPKALAAVVDATARRMDSAPEPLASMAALFHELLAKYGPEDVGLLVLLFLNPVELLPGQALFLPPGLPHAYLRGNIVECMANSDNVIRLGLTPKPKDLQRIPQVLRFDPTNPEPLSPPDEAPMVYPAPCEEFEVHRWIVKAGQNLSVTRPDGPEVILVIKGRGRIFWRENGQLLIEPYDKGHSFLIPALLTVYGLEAETRTVAFTVRVPEGGLSKP